MTGGEAGGKRDHEATPDLLGLAPAAKSPKVLDEARTVDCVAPRDAPTDTLRSMSNAPTEKSWPFICPHCEQASNGVVRGKAVWDGYNKRGEPDNPPAEWTLVQCHRCSQPTLQIREDFGRGFSEDEHPLTAYPAPRRLAGDVPPGIRREWEEARTCFGAKAYAACVVMVRRTLEGTCQEQGITERTLEQSLQKMAADGKIDSTLSDWAEVLRKVGNKGAHFTGKPVAREDAEDALSFAEAMLEHIYVLRRRFDKFRSRHT